MTKLEELIKNLCPNEVEYKRFDEACTLNARIGWQRLTKAEYKTTGDYMLITGTDFTISYTINYDSCVYVSEDRYSQDSKIQIKNGDVLITKDGTLGKVAQVNFLPMPATLNGGVFVVRPKDNSLLPRYIMHFLLSDHFQKVVDQQKTGSTISHLTQALFSRLQIPVPPIPVQEEIVRILDSFTELTAELTARKKQYEYYRDSLLSFNSQTVQKVKLGDIASIVRGASPRPIAQYITSDSNGVNWIKIGDVKPNSKYITSTEEKITPEGAKKSRLVKKGDFILSNSMSFGRPYILKIDGCIHDGWLSISDFSNTLTADFLYHVLSSSMMQYEMRKKASFGGAVQNLNADIVRELTIPIPSLETQNKIVQVLDNFDSICSDLKIGLPAEIEARKKQYEFYRDKLLSF